MIYSIVPELVDNKRFNVVSVSTNETKDGLITERMPSGSWLPRADDAIGVLEQGVSDERVSISTRITLMISTTLQVEHTGCSRRRGASRRHF